VEREAISSEGQSRWVKRKAPSRPKRFPRLRRWGRRLGITFAIFWVLGISLWVGVNRIPWLGPAIAEGLRSVLGPAAVAWLEDVAYGLEDRVNVWRHGEDAPTTFWDVPAVVPARDPAPGEPPAFTPPLATAPFPKVATPADGVWVPIADPADPAAPPRMFKTMIHPDERRPFAVLAVVAIDMHAFDLHLMAGTTEPLSQRIQIKDRPGKVPPVEAPYLFAAFNGGFRATHGQYGMLLDGIEYLPPRDFACTFASYKDGSFKIGTWSDIKADKEQMVYYRQTPPCLVEAGDVHKLLHYNEYAKGWGATVSGDTIIRRSAIGLDAEHKILFYALGDAMTASSLARGIKAAGAHDAAELDVNYSYPRLLFYEKGDKEGGPFAVSAIIADIKFSKYDYVGQASERDFFYLLRKGQKDASITAGGDSQMAAN
jgi:phosphodiester glycosidase